jgi:hypothetical protein
VSAPERHSAGVHGDCRPLVVIGSDARGRDRLSPTRIEHSRNTAVVDNADE